jgi:UPF0716 family protein affecting phage T7 exclusion
LDDIEPSQFLLRRFRERQLEPRRMILPSVLFVVAAVLLVTGGRVLHFVGGVIWLLPRSSRSVGGCAGGERRGKNLILIEL